MKSVYRYMVSAYRYMAMFYRCTGNLLSIHGQRLSLHGINMGGCTYVVYLFWHSTPQVVYQMQGHQRKLLRKHAHSETAISIRPFTLFVCACLVLNVCTFGVCLVAESNLDQARQRMPMHTKPTNTQVQHLIVPLLEDFPKKAPTPNRKLSIHGG